VKGVCCVGNRVTNKSPPNRTDICTKPKSDHTICFTICLCISPDLDGFTICFGNHDMFHDMFGNRVTICFTICLFISPDLDGLRYVHDMFV
jgi:hypothetical protein